MTEQTNTTTVDSEYADEAIIAFQGRSGSLSNPPHLGDSRRYVIAGTCTKVSDELQENGDTKTVCTIKARNVYEIGNQKPDDGTGLFREPCPHCGHADVGSDVVDGEFTDEDGSDEPAAIEDAQLAIEAGTGGDDVVDAEVVEDDDVVDAEVIEDPEGADPEDDGGPDDEVDIYDADDNDGYEPSGMDEFTAMADEAEPVEDGAGSEDDDPEADPDGEESDEEREAREERNRKARERYAARKQREQEAADAEDGDDQ